MVLNRVPNKGSFASQRIASLVSGAAGLCAIAGCDPIVIEAFEPAVMVDSTSPVDLCPDDPSKVAAGDCGCGVPDDDFDKDGAADCIETCPDNPNRTSPLGPCGCSSLPDTLSCGELRAAVRNLYTFDATGTEIVDAAGGMNGTILDANGVATRAELEQLQRGGRLRFDGVGSYVELPPGMISPLTSATLEAWANWGGGDPWARIFDFGNNDGGAPTIGISYLFLTTSNVDSGTLRVAYSLASGGDAETRAEGSRPLGDVASAGTAEHVAVVIDDVAGSMELFLNGESQSRVAFEGALDAINDVNGWLGRSNYGIDPAFLGTLLEFRIYDRALSAAQIRTSFQAGPGSLSD